MPTVRASSCRLLALFVMACLAACHPGPRLSRAPQASLVEAEVDGLGEPEVVVDNLTDVPLSLRLSGAANLKLEVPAHQQRSIRMKPGSYAYQATALLAPPAGGSARFLEDHRYRWTFAIVRMPSDDPALAGTGFHCFDPEHELPFKSCYRAKEVCEQRARGFFAAASRASCERSSSSYLYSFRYAGADETHRDFAATRAECEDRRAERLKFALVDRASVSPCKELDTSALCGAKELARSDRRGACSPSPVIYRFADPGRDAVLSAPTLEECESMRSMYLKLSDVDVTTVQACVRLN